MGAPVDPTGSSERPGRISARTPDGIPGKTPTPASPLWPLLLGYLLSAIDYWLSVNPRRTEIHRGHKVLLYFRPNSQAYLPCRSKRPTYSKADAESEGR